MFICMYAYQPTGRGRRVANRSIVTAVRGPLFVPRSPLLAEISATVGASGASREHNGCHGQEEEHADLEPIFSLILIM